MSVRSGIRAAVLFAGAAVAVVVAPAIEAGGVLQAGRRSGRDAEESLLTSLPMVGGLL